MSLLDEALDACRRRGAKMPPPLAAWLIARTLESELADQVPLGNALVDLLGGSGPPELEVIITRMVHPDAKQRWPLPLTTLREALYGYAGALGSQARLEG